MMTGMILNAWKNVKQHVPLIKFRKGGPIREIKPSSSTVAPASGIQSKSSGLPPRNTQQLPAIEDWQLPPQYRRAALDEKEIDAINSGGAY